MAVPAGEYYVATNVVLVVPNLFGGRGGGVRSSAPTSDVYVRLSVWDSSGEETRVAVATDETISIELSPNPGVRDFLQGLQVFGVLSSAAPPVLLIGPGSTALGEGELQEVDALALWDNNRNGRITCAEARAHGIAPVFRNHPAYRYMDDRDRDGVVCE